MRVLIPRDLPKIHADPELVGEAVFQMAHNAVKFNQSGGWVRIQASFKDQYIVYEVSDNGIGLTAKRLETLGEPFSHTTKALQRGQEGLGVGWAFVVYVAEVHNGWTHIESPGPEHGQHVPPCHPVIQIKTCDQARGLKVSIKSAIESRSI